MRCKARLAGWIVSISALSLAPVALAGDLNPPGGAVSPTMKDLDDVEPRTVIRNDPDPFTPIVISQPGSYYLGENINALPLQHGIEITAGDVTLDLNGFTITGDTDAGSLDGVRVSGNTSGVVIRNGRIRLFVGDGVDFGVSVKGLVEDVVVEGCGGDGFFLWDNSRAERCQALNNGGDGFDVNTSGEVRRGLARGNSGDGFVGSLDARFIDCFAGFNTGSGFHLTFQRGVIRDCISRSNNIGYDVDDLANTIVRNTAYLNTTEYDIVPNNFVGPIKFNLIATEPLDNFDF